MYTVDKHWLSYSSFEFKSAFVNFYACIYKCIYWRKNKTSNGFQKPHQSEQIYGCNHKTWVYFHLLVRKLPILEQPLIPGTLELLVFMSCIQYIAHWRLHKPNSLQNSNEQMGNKLICVDLMSISASLSGFLLCAWQAAFEAIHPECLREQLCYSLLSVILQHLRLHFSFEISKSNTSLKTSLKAAHTGTKSFCVRWKQVEFKYIFAKRLLSGQKCRLCPR